MTAPSGLAAAPSISMDAPVILKASACSSGETPSNNDRQAMKARNAPALRRFFLGAIEQGFGIDVGAGLHRFALQLRQHPGSGGLAEILSLAKLLDSLSRIVATYGALSPIALGKN